MTERPEVLIFWDASAPPKSSIGGYAVVKAVRSFAGRLGVIKALRFYVDIWGNGTARFPPLLASELQCSGVSIIDTVASGRPGSSSKMLLADCFLHAMDSSSSVQGSITVIISADPDIGYAISLLRSKGHCIVLLCPTRANTNLHYLSGENNLDGVLFDITSGDVQGGPSGSNNGTYRHLNEDARPRATNGARMTALALGIQALLELAVSDEGTQPADVQHNSPRVLEESDPIDRQSRTNPATQPPFSVPHDEEEEGEQVGNLPSLVEHPSRSASTTSSFSIVPPASLWTAPTSTVTKEILSDHKEFLDAEKDVPLASGDTDRSKLDPPIAQTSSHQTTASEATITPGNVETSTVLPELPVRPDRPVEIAIEKSTPFPALTTEASPISTIMPADITTPTAAAQTAKITPIIPPLYTTLVLCLREQIAQGSWNVRRTKLQALMLQRQPNIFVLAGTSKNSKPIKEYLVKAKDLGIITSQSKKQVSLSPQYH